MKTLIDKLLELVSQLPDNPLRAEIYNAIQDIVSHEVLRLKLSLSQHSLINYNELNTAMEIVNGIRQIIPNFPVNMANKPIIPMGDTMEEK